MAAGCPTLVSNIKVFYEICGNASIFFDPNDPADIANKILDLIMNKNLQISLKEKGLAHAARFSWDKCAIKTIELIHDLVGN
jgi:glycosyltransferase involved in cell wall biosynthesis